MKYFLLLLPFLLCFSLLAQDRVGINENDPEFILDVRGTDDEWSGGELQLATPSGEHFLRLFGGRIFDPKPFILFSNIDTFRIASSAPDYANFIDIMTVHPEGLVGIREEQPTQILDVGGKIKIADDNGPDEEGTIRYKETDGNFEGYTSDGWKILNNKLIYEDNRLHVALGSVVRNQEVPWGDTITIQENGDYLLFVSAYFSSTINEVYANGTPAIDAPYDNRGRLKIYINSQQHRLLECGNGILDRNGPQYHVAFAPGTRSSMEVLSLNAGDKISLTRDMQAVPALEPSIVIPDLWICQMDAFYIMKLD